MIDDYNRKQIARSILASVLGTVAYVLAYFFFSLAFSIFMTGFGFVKVSTNFNEAFALACLGIITAVGTARGLKGEGHYGFEDSGIHVEIDADSGGAFATEVYANRVTVPAYWLSQIFLAGPLQYLKSRRYWNSRIAKEAGLETRLAALLAEVESRPKRHSVAEYSGREKELFMLASMDKIAFSPRKGTVFKKI